MPQDQTSFDDILDQLAQGATYAARDDSGDLLIDAREDVSDGGPESSRSRQAVGSARPTAQVQVFAEPAHSHRGSESMLLLPRPGPMVRVFSLAMVALMAGMTIMAALVALAVQQLAGEARQDERFQATDTLVELPVVRADLLDEERFAGLLERWPAQRQRLLLKRFRALAEDGDWRLARVVFEEARREDALTVPAADRLRYCRVLIALREIERAQAELEALDHATLDAEQRQQVAGMVSRLQLARMQ